MVAFRYIHVASYHQTNQVNKYIKALAECRIDTSCIRFLFKPQFNWFVRCIRESKTCSILTVSHLSSEFLKFQWRKISFDLLLCKIQMIAVSHVDKLVHGIHNSHQFQWLIDGRRHDEWNCLANKMKIVQHWIFCSTENGNWNPSTVEWE